MDCRPGVLYPSLVRDFLSAQAPLIFRLARSELTRPAARSIAGRVKADDVAQDVFCSLLSSHERGAFQPGRIENAEAYLRRVVRRVIGAARVFHRRERLSLAGELPESARPSPEGRQPLDPEYLALQKGDAHRRIEATKNRLGPRDALVCALLLDDGLSIEEAAEKLAVKRNYVYQVRSRIRQALAAVLLEEGFATGDVVAMLGTNEKRRRVSALATVVVAACLVAGGTAVCLSAGSTAALRGSGSALLPLDRAPDAWSMASF